MDRSTSSTQALAGRRVFSWVAPLARVGYLAKGVVYLLVGYVAARAALASGTPTGGTGALREALIAGGPWLVLLIGAGLLAHVAWRLVQALLDPENPGASLRLGVRAFHFVSGLVYGSLAITAYRLWQGRRDSGDNGEENFAAMLMAQPFGRWLVGLVGVAIVAYGIHQFRRGLARRRRTPPGHPRPGPAPPGGRDRPLRHGRARRRARCGRKLLHRCGAPLRSKPGRRHRGGVALARQRLAAGADGVGAGRLRTVPGGEGALPRDRSAWLRKRAPRALGQPR
jgi:hypothetical protein